MRRFFPSSLFSASGRPANRRIRLVLPCLLALLPVALAARADEILPFSELKVGMKGEGRSVFQGTRISRFSAEIIGLMENIAPKRNLILVRLTGDPVDRTGVMEGMSGSPVYINGRVIGAVAYSWNFSKEAIAGVTPIEEMLDVQKRSGGTPGHSRSAPADFRGVSPLRPLPPGEDPRPLRSLPERRGRRARAPGLVQPHRDSPLLRRLPRPGHRAPLGRISPGPDSSPSRRAWPARALKRPTLCCRDRRWP